MKVLKRWLPTIAILSAFLLLTSCSAADDNSLVEGAFTFSKKSPLEGNFTTEYLGHDELGWVLYDKETGCQYLAMSSNTPFTPRLNSQGTPMCRDTQESEDKQ
ncbi:DUF6440 family protein [uncultured Chitinophaga sp.]|uniref:DUF6440 family protein n=1 Tax=uncultured Chitinophaga sp. TaxID=339340 RepID=UPI00345375ED